MNKRIGRVIGTILGVWAVGLGASASAQSTLYDNSTTPLGTSYEPPVGTEFGNEIAVASPLAVLINSVSFQYSGAASDVELKIYENNGPQFNPGFPNTAEPGSLLYDSGTLALPGSVNGQTVTYGGPGAASLNVLVPARENFTWTVTFTGSAGSVGLDFYGPPTTGLAFNSFWQNTGGGWAAYQSAQNPRNISTFGAIINGAPISVPEPSSYALAGLGMVVVWLGRFGKRRAA
jgi:hypothetical protein